jgi:hypothetical protein
MERSGVGVVGIVVYGANSGRHLAYDKLIQKRHVFTCFIAAFTQRVCSALLPVRICCFLTLRLLRQT